MQAEPVRSSGGGRSGALVVGSRVLQIVDSSVLQMRHRTLEEALLPLPGLPPWTFVSLRAPSGALLDRKSVV